MTQDDPKQSPRATRLIEALAGEAPGFVPVVALVEVVWVLSGSYGLERSAADAGCTDTMTFDTGAARSAGMRLIGA